MGWYNFRTMADENTIIASSINQTIFGNSQRQMACLVQYSGGAIGKRYPIDQQEIVAGRSPSLAFNINDPSVSRNHVKFCYKGTDVEVEDLNSTNGTFINERKLNKPDVLRDGDMVRIGTIVFKFFAQGSMESLFHDRIYRMATIDATTQIFNKKYLMETLEAEFKIAKTYGRPLSLIMYDLDFFKKVNDTHGHNAGDFILKECSQIAKASVRKQDTLGRFGGEEFGIVLPDSEMRAAAEMAERIRKAVGAHPFQFENKVIQQTISMGVAQLTPQVASVQDFLDIADKKLYRSKGAGRNQVTI